MQVIEKTRRTVFKNTDVLIFHNICWENVAIFSRNTRYYTGSNCILGKKLLLLQFYVFFMLRFMNRAFHTLQKMLHIHRSCYYSASRISLSALRQNLGRSLSHDISHNVSSCSIIIINLIYLSLLLFQVSTPS